MVQLQPVLMEGSFDKTAGTWSVTRDKAPVTIDRSRGIAGHSHIFQWGYIGSGASQLAIEMMLEAGATDVEASEFQGRFKRDVVVRWGETFSVTVEELQAFLSVYRTLKALE